MKNSKNLQQLILAGFVFVIVLMFNSCGDPIANQVNITSDPDKPVVQLYDVPSTGDSDGNLNGLPGFEDGATAPWFQYDFVIENSSDKTFVLTSLELEARLLDGLETGSAAITAADLTEDELQGDNPLALAVVEPKKSWQASDFLGVPFDPDPTDSDSSLTGLIPRTFVISGLPSPSDDEFGEVQTTLYEVTVNATGYFAPDSDDDDPIVFERTYKFFTE